ARGAWLGGVLVVLLVADGVAVEHVAGLVAGALHRDALGHSATHHVPRRCPPQVMEDPPRDVRSFARRRPGPAEGLSGPPLRPKEHRATPERLAGPLPLGLRPLSPENRDELQ